MTPSKALKTLEARHTYLLGLIEKTTDGRIQFHLAEAAALEFAMDAVMKQTIADRTYRNARHEAMAYIPKESC